MAIDTESSAASISRLKAFHPDYEGHHAAEASRKDLLSSFPSFYLLRTVQLNRRIEIAQATSFCCPLDRDTRTMSS